MLLMEVNQLCCELRSEKIANVNKSIDRLDNILSSSKNNLISLLKCRSSSHDVSWKEILSSIVEATIKRSVKLNDAKDTKGFQTLKNKNDIFSSVLNKIIDYNLEEGSPISKDNILNEFFGAFGNRLVIKYFGIPFVQMLENGIFKSKSNISDLKVNEFSRIISFLFEAKFNNDEKLRYNILRCINKTIEIGIQYTQFYTDLSDYWSEVRNYCLNAGDERTQTEALKLLYLMTSQLKIDFHPTVCDKIQELLPIACGLYNYRMKAEAKDLLYKYSSVSLNVIYANLKVGDFTTMNPILDDCSWRKTIRKLYSIVEIEIREKKSQLHHISQTNINCSEAFIKLAADVLYVIQWNKFNENEDSPIGSKPKMQKLSTKMDYVLDLILLKSGELNGLWFSVFTKLITVHDHLIDISTLEAILKVLLQPNCIVIKSYELQYLRKSFEVLLRKEYELGIVSLNDCYAKMWSEFIKSIIADTSLNAEIVKENQLLIQLFIQYGKISQDDCGLLFQSYISNRSLRRNECITTVRTILVYNKIAKTLDMATKLIEWLHPADNKIDAKTLLLNIAPIDIDLMVDTEAIAIINFLGEMDQCIVVGKSIFSTEENTNKYILFKYCHKYICLENYGTQIQRIHVSDVGVDKSEEKNCLIQNSYELLMRRLNFETSKENKTSDIVFDLSNFEILLKLKCTFYKYGITDEDNYQQCPLPKRIGFFFNHIEFQLKSLDVKRMLKPDLMELLQKLESILFTICNNSILLKILDGQNFDGFIQFFINCISLGDSSLSLMCEEDFDQNSSSITFISQKILSYLCCNDHHRANAFLPIKAYKFNMEKNTHQILDLIKILCKQNVDEIIAVWSVEKLKEMCQLHHKDIKISNDVISILPIVFHYVHMFNDLIKDMMIILSSFMKKCFKNSYSVSFTCNVIRIVKDIAQNKSELFDYDDFLRICIATAKFLLSPSLRIQCATIDCITALMDANWIFQKKLVPKRYFEFCIDMFETLDLDNAMIEEENTHTDKVFTLTQILTSLFAFSTFHKKFAFLHLAESCKLLNLNEANFCQFRQISTYFDCSIETLSKPFVEPMLNMWIEKEYPLKRLPWFLCCGSKDEFYEKYKESVTHALVRYSIANLDDLQQQTKTSLVSLLKISKSKSLAFVLPYLAKNQTISSIHITKAKICLIHWKSLKIDFNLQENTIKNDSRVIYELSKFLWDENHFQKIFGFDFFVTANVFYLNFDCFKSTLSFYLNNNLDVEDSFILSSLIQDHPRVLLDVLRLLKIEIHTTIFLEDKLINLYRYCVLTELYLTSCSTKSKEKYTNIRNFLYRNAIFFTINLLQLQKSYYEMQLAALFFLKSILTQALVSNVEVVKTYLNDITRSLIFLIETSKYSDIQSMCSKLLEFLICDRKDFDDSIAILDEFPSSEEYRKLRQVQYKLLKRDGNDLKNDLNNFLIATNRGIEGLKALKFNISTKKTELHELSKALINENELYETLKRLIHISRNAKPSVAIEALKCLGEIGPLRIANLAFYFDTDLTFYNMESTYRNDVEYFVRSLFSVLDKLLLAYNAPTISFAYEVCEHIVNSGVGKKMLPDFPYFQIFANRETKSFLDQISSIQQIDLITLLQSTEKLSYQNWIATFTSKVYECFNWEPFQMLAKSDISFSEASIIPIFKILIQNKETNLESTLAMLEYFFTESFNTMKNENISNTIYTDKKAIKFFIDICECIRLNNDWKVPINLLYVSKACIHCQAYFMSIMYLELWALEETFVAKNKKYSVMENIMFQEVASKAYQSIGCSDAISGFLSPISSRLEFLNLSNSWSEVLLELDGTNSIENPLFSDILRRNGLLSLVGATRLNNVIDYETCWRLGQWDITTDVTSQSHSVNDLEHEFEKYHFLALKSIYNKEEVNALNSINNGRKCILSILNEISIECIQSVYKYLTWLNLLQQEEDFCDIQFLGSSDINGILIKWENSDKLDLNFSFKEILLSQRIALFKSAGVRANRKIKDFYQGKSIIGHYLLDCIKECKNAGQINLTIRNIAQLKNMETELSPDVKASVLIEDSEICWKTGKSTMATAILRSLIKSTEFLVSFERVHALRIYGEYLVETNIEPFDDVCNKYFKGSVDSLNALTKNLDKLAKLNPQAFESEKFNTFSLDCRKKNYASFAKYADKEYTKLNAYKSSEAYLTKVKIMNKNQEDAQRLKSSGRDRDTLVGRNVLLRNANIDDSEIKLVNTKRSEYLCIAVENYIQFCKIDNAITSPVIYRLIALWFANKQDEQLKELIEKNIGDIPSYKFLCMLNQMSAQLSCKNQEFSDLLQNILVNCAQQHPHHTLYQLLALVFANADNSDKSIDEERLKISKKIITKAGKEIQNLVKQMEAMFTGLIEFANKSTTGMKSLTLSDKLRKLKNLEHVQCPTIELPISVNGEYNVTSVSKWEENVSLVGGINAPKKLRCICSDGVSRPQLLKGKDDLRQDAVMQQVLSLVNELLKGDRETRDQKLILRTYRVVPLSKRSGILEWCNNTLPLGTYLMGHSKESGAHKKYRPDDYSISKCRKLMMECLKQDRSNHKKRYELFEHICDHLKPVFHYFFLEKFLIPGIWFERRLAYINSVATTSIVGYILGLGDRHAQNILIDEITAEVIHIDFGIAFEQGKIMPTPETVPFRLTRDVLAPMGICEPEGIFKKSCEKTMKILRKNQAVLMTILEVLLYDPLYIWNISSKTVLSQNDDNSENEENDDEDCKNFTAQRALLRVQAKLEGSDETNIGTSTIEVQVQRLINEAMNHKNLCLLFPGWDPYL